MKKHLFLTGALHIGKSTVIADGLQSAGVTPAGFVTVRVPADGGYDIHLLAADGSDAPCGENRVAVCRGGGYEAVPGAFDHAGAPLLRRAKKAPLAVMDELGFLESGETEFVSAVYAVLDSPCRVLGVLKRCDAELVAGIAARSDVAVAELTAENVDAVSRTVSEFLAEAARPSLQRL